MSANLREELHTMAEQIPEDASWADVMARLRFRQAVAEGKAAADNKEFADDEQVSRVFEKYGVRH
ncbi:MAG TPA: hypothetical protein VFK45_07710 [Gammaproteobacteria bacterium]|nr:hypothetical protein [Gammaproteobacteria bacterium]